MQILRSVEELKSSRNKIQGSVGFVPTMGYLHEGHLSLVRRAKAENDIAAVSIFVNPTQFLPHEDFQTYPRNEAQDLALLQKESVDLVFLPEIKDIYAEGNCTFVNVEGIADVLEGASRPGHFRGVATVVAKLFNLMEPTRAYFGQKDAQQLAVIKRMVSDLYMPLKIVGCPTVRETDGLALSSRNRYLSPQQRKDATCIYRSLKIAREMIEAGETNPKTIAVRMRKIISSAKSLTGIDYISIVKADTLEDIRIIKGRVLMAVAVRFGSTRLIDNLTVDCQRR